MAETSTLYGKEIRYTSGRILNYSVILGIQELLGPRMRKKFMERPRHVQQTSHPTLVLLQQQKWSPYLLHGMKP